jgi:hypothetical protein
MEKEMQRMELSCFKSRANGSGKIEKYGLRTTSEGKIATILLSNVIIQEQSGEEQRTVDHAWFSVNKSIDFKDFKIGDEITFTCLVKEYSKNRDYSQTHAYGIRKIRSVTITKSGKGLKIVDFINSFINRDSIFAPHSLIN